MLLIYLSCAWVLGIAAGSVFDSAFFLAFTGLVPLTLLFFVRKYRKLLLLTGLCIIAFFSGAAYFNNTLPDNNPDSLQFYNDRGEVEIRGLVNADPEPGEKTVRLQLSAEEINIYGEWQTVSGTALIYAPGYADYDYGDFLRIKGKPETPPKFDDFDYQAYLANKEIYTVISYPEIELLSTGRGNRPLEWIYSLSDRLSAVCSEILPEPHSSLVRGVVLGIRGGIPETVRDDFAHTGTAHLLAISGLHLSIIAGMLLSFGIRVFGREHYIYVWLALVGVWIYALLTGMNPPVLRAAIMASLFLVAELLGRQRSAGTALAFAAAIMVGFNPRILWQASFQMSFAAMAGLVFIFPHIQPLLRRAADAIPGEQPFITAAAGFIADSLSISIGALAAVWPLIAYHFGIISPAAPLATLFALPSLPGVIFTGIAAGIAGIIFLPAGQVIAWITWLFTGYMMLVVRIFSAVPFVEGSYFDIRMVWAYYTVLSAIIWLVNSSDGVASIEHRTAGFVSGLQKKWLIAPLLVIAVLVSVTAVTMPDDNLRVSFLDVGQGDSILIQKGSRQVLVDGGPYSQAVNLALGEKMPFWDRNIDMVVLTHPSADHITGLIEVLKRYRVEQAIYPETDFKSGIYDEWLRLVKEKETEFTVARAGQRIKLGGAIVIDILNPQGTPLTGTQSDIDNNGMVLRIETGEISFLLTADIMQEAEMEMVYNRAGLKSTVLKVAHHGSSTSTSGVFLSVVNPRIAVIQVGADNPFGHPKDEVLNKLEATLGEENIYRTDEDGTVEFITDGEKLWVNIESR